MEKANFRYGIRKAGAIAKFFHRFEKLRGSEEFEGNACIGSLGG